MSLAVVQATVNSNQAAGVTAPAATFTSTPTSGNLMVAVVWMSQEGGTLPSAQNGWTLKQTVTSTGGFGVYVAMYYRYAGASEPKSQPMETGSRHIWFVGMWEISGVSGAIASDFVAFHASVNDNLNTVPITTTSFNTTNNNELLLLACGGYTGTAGTSVSSSLGTSDASVSPGGGSTDGFGTYDDCHAYHLTEATAGTAVSATITQSNNNNTATAWGWVELNAASTETANPVTLALGGVSFNVSAAREETSAASLVLGGVKFNAAGSVAKSAAAALVLSGVAFKATSLDLGAPGSGAVHFSTFGA